MPVYKSLINTGSEEFRARYAHNKALAVELRRKQHEARHVRPQRDLDRLAKQGKLTPRVRIAKLLDPGTPFLEFSTLAANSAYNGESPGASHITGIGIVSGREVIVHADDSTVKGGAWYPLTIHKMVRCLDIAIENRLPVVHLCDSAGGQLQLQSDVFPDKYLAGRIFRKSGDLKQDGREASRARAWPLHGRRGLYSQYERLQRYRSGNRRRFSRRPTACESSHRPDNDRRRNRWL